MTSFSFSKNQGVTAITGAMVTAILAWAYFARVWRGVLVSDAGSPGMNGYYVWDPAFKWYLGVEVPAGGRRVPNVYDLVARGPDVRSNASTTTYAIMSIKDEVTHARFWFLGGSEGLAYVAKATSYLDNTPPSTGWMVAGPPNKTTAGLEPLPQVTVLGQRVGPDYSPEATRSSPSSSMPNEGMPAEKDATNILNTGSYPGTDILLGINLIVACYLRKNGVSSDAVAISYTLFWETREYWRIFTASFSHFTPLHLFFNALGTWSLRAVEWRLGTFRFLWMTLALVVTTIMADMLIKLALLSRGGPSSTLHKKAFGFSCVLFAYTTYAAVAMDKYCPFGKERYCFQTWRLPFFGGDLPVNFGPFASLLVTQAIVPRASFTGHLAGIIMGYPMAWGLLERLSVPVIAGVSVIFMIQHSQGWAHKITSSSELLKDWSLGDAKRVVRAQRLRRVFMAHVGLTAAILCVFTLSSGLAEGMALVVGYSALQALKCCCRSDRQQTEQDRICVKLLRGYGVLSVVLFVSDLLSFGAIVGQASYMEWSGVSWRSQQQGLALLAIAVIVHASAAVACTQSGALFRHGQAFLLDTGLSSCGTGAPVSGWSFPGAGQALGAAGSNVSARHGTNDDPGARTTRKNQ